MMRVFADLDKPGCVTIVLDSGQLVYISDCGQIDTPALKIPVEEIASWTTIYRELK